MIRSLNENYFAKIKQFRGIATRYDITDTSCGANLNLVKSGTPRESRRRRTRTGEKYTASVTVL